jgi:hypothetical protein
VRSHAYLYSLASVSPSSVHNFRERGKGYHHHLHSFKMNPNVQPSRCDAESTSKSVIRMETHERNRMCCRLDQGHYSLCIMYEYISKNSDPGNGKPGPFPGSQDSFNIPTATCTALSFRRRPQAEMSNT